MSEITKCYLIGAGASYGHNDQLPDADRPPTGEYIFVDCWEKGLLDREEFRPLLEKLVIYLDNLGKLVEIEPKELKYDVELLLREFHQDLQEEVKEILNNPSRISDAGFTSQTAISLCYYLIYELFRGYTKSFSPEGSYYTELANHFKEAPYSVISLNYDVLFEKSIRHTGQEFHYLPEYGQSGIPFAKIHGSINLLNDFGSGISTNTDDFIEKVRHVHTNVVEGQIEYLDFDDLEKLDFRDLAFGLDGHYEPAIVPPLAKYKNYKKITIYPAIWEFAERLLQPVEELIIIGSSLTTRDSELLSLLRKNLKGDVKITIVSGKQSDSVRAKLDMRLDNPSFNLNYQRFEDYIESI